MKIVVALDSFKGSMTAEQACLAAVRGLKKALPDSHIIPLPVADGGEGLIETIRHSAAFSDAELIHVDVTGPYYTQVKAAYLRSDQTAIIEMAQSCGLELTPESQRDARFATSYGFGELVMHALESGCRRFIIGLGGSATNDAGIGFAQALGVRFYDDDGQPIPVPARATHMQDVSSVDRSHLPLLLQDISIDVCCDVSNPLLGETGATYVYGQQKGGTPETLYALEMAMSNYAAVVEDVTGRRAIHISGAGAAGGMGAALIWFTNAVLKPGIQVVLDLIQIDDVLSDSQLVITGEGKIDRQTAYGKVPVGVAQRAAAQGIPVIALAGSIDFDMGQLSIPNIHAMSAIVQQPMPLSQAMASGEYLTEIAAEQMGYLLKIGQKIAPC
ncbi:glycerate kinase [Photobacterium sp. GJ3]|uniref:glycerate kinase n=1 Tax=Photobacterium sp. GJ3 TaxID=2829502 RepID=UPI001B8CBB79|nr:glycerate kinase [Photobacterium sp. GJ3]QUJ67970.1 glycerate kinase [Photobacterium sp. GJ3]